MRHLGRLGIVFLVLFSASASPGDPSLPPVMANDNRTPAGQLKDGILELRLELREGVWYPEDESGGHRDVYAFVEAGHVLQSSGPLIRVPQGTEIHATIHNTLPLKAKIYGLHRHPGDPKDALSLAPGESHELRFLAGEPGTYMYWGTTSDKTSVELRADAETMSYYDGVAGWTGSGQQTTPPIAPGTSFIAHMTPPRAGTFIYHTHWHDNAQLLNGLYGPLIVLEPGQKYDPEHDRTFVFSGGYYAPFGYLLLVNGHPQPDSVELHSSTRYRLRFINITDNGVDLRVRLTNKGVPVQWTVIAKDGADRPLAQVKSSTADMGITVGETYDVEYQAETPDLADLQIWQPQYPTPVTLPLKFVEAK